MRNYLAQFCSVKVLKNDLLWPHTFTPPIWNQTLEYYYKRVILTSKKTSSKEIILKLRIWWACTEAFRELGLLPLNCLYILKVALYFQSVESVQSRHIHWYETCTLQRTWDNVELQRSNVCQLNVALRYLTSSLKTLNFVLTQTILKLNHNDSWWQKHFVLCIRLHGLSLGWIESLEAVFATPMIFCFNVLR